jgi:hypothetical protein
MLATCSSPLRVYMPALIGYPSSWSRISPAGTNFL